MQCGIWDNVHYNPPKYMASYNSTTGLVTGMDTDANREHLFNGEDARDSAMALINGNSANAATFIGSVPVPPHH